MDRHLVDEPNTSEKVLEPAASLEPGSKWGVCLSLQRSNHSAIEARLEGLFSTTETQNFANPTPDSDSARPRRHFEPVSGLKKPKTKSAKYMLRMHSFFANFL